MFTFHARKRARDEDSDSDDDRYLKKSRPWSIQSNQNGQSKFGSPSALPLRPSLPPSPPEHTLPHFDAMTPTPPEHRDANSPASLRDDSFAFPSQPHADTDMDMIMDMAMDDDDFDVVGSQPPDSPFVQQHFLRPPKLNSNLFNNDPSTNNTGRIPTPIYPNFHKPSGTMGEGGMGGMGYPNGGLAGGVNGDHPYLGVPGNPMLQTPPVPRKHAQIDADRSRRMPSPISEDDDLPDTPTALTQSQLSRLSVTSNAEHMDVEIRDGFEEHDMAPPPGVVTTPSRGRKRSGALSRIGRFAMGYRDDCDKCRQRVPGHYSHFLP